MTTIDFQDQDDDSEEKTGDDMESSNESNVDDTDLKAQFKATHAN